ncbi:hypothetical protein HETIRDRAFT_105442 [Heterobasidion irregulare TC 32-1]|uniref:Uncharacterized protein n=1 Tax=Heterobasidion irregulare (strain TC 32-1) TaxID=747525 RepID=W4JX26_HETIT|nr:uncharacterized protein HETIRDRAFT_105442 [Heterobasidion irregulare TC 32-1]ETW77426.1 hypothetical protein HETIRDRAFT_105442 [Heterobasidion irregulare TC 32-1]
MAKRRADDSGSCDDDEGEKEEEELVGRRVVNRITPYLDYDPTRLPSKQERRELRHQSCHVPVDPVSTPFYAPPDKGIAGHGMNPSNNFECDEYGWPFLLPTDELADASC